MLAQGQNVLAHGHNVLAHRHNVLAHLHNVLAHAREEGRGEPGAREDSTTESDEPGKHSNI